MGMSARTGTFDTVSLISCCRRPPITMVSPSCTVTVVVD